MEVRPVEGQIDDLIGEVNKEIAKKNKILITTLTKRMAEDLTDYMRELGIRVRYLHSDIDTLERTEIVRDMRLDVFDVLVGINLLREGLDIPEITLVAILDADKEGSVSYTHLFQEGNQCQTLLGVTGSGKTFTMANVIAQLNKPTLIIAHNKTLAAQLYGEFKEFFPNNAVEYFVS